MLKLIHRNMKNTIHESSISFPKTIPERRVTQNSSISSAFRSRYKRKEENPSRYSSGINILHGLFSRNDYFPETIIFQKRLFSRNDYFPETIIFQKRLFSRNELSNVHETYLLQRIWKNRYRKCQNPSQDDDTVRTNVTGSTMKIEDWRNDREKTYRNSEKSLRNTRKWWRIRERNRYQSLGNDWNSQWSYRHSAILSWKRTSKWWRNRTRIAIKLRKTGTSWRIRCRS